MSGTKPMDRPTLNPQLVEEASDWFIEFAEDTVDADARARFDAWLRRSPEHVEAYLKVATLWEEAPALATHRVGSAGELIARVRAEGNIVPFERPAAPAAASESLAPTSLQRPPRSRVGPLALVASFILVLVGSGLWFLMDRLTYTTGIGEHHSVRLDDGSTVDLNAESKIRVRFSARERRLELLKGQALFRVARDATRPFLVLTNTTQVRAVGTEFDVNRRSSDTVVTVLEGRVAVLSEIARSEPLPPPAASIPGTPTAPSSPALHPSLEPLGREILVAAGEQVRVSTLSVSPPEAADLPVATAWTQRKIAFKGAPLSDVVEEFNRNNPRPLVVTDPTLSGIRISGVFSSTDPESLLRFLRSLPDIKVAETNHDIEISRR